jgi:hypothetical protein
MATTKTGNPWIVTSADTTVHTSPVRVNYFKWTPEASGDDILVKDNGGNTLWDLKALAGSSDQNISVSLNLNCSVNGINVTTIDSGTLYIHLY